ncbi:urease accessory protein UreF [Roseivivax sp. CAU 1761]
MATPTDLPDLAALATLAQWLSPAYPVGAFAYSHGLEAAVETGRVRDAAALEGWIAALLREGAGASEPRFLAAAWHAPDAEAVAEIDARARAFAASRERLIELDLQGAAFAATTAALTGHALPRLAYPVAVGRAARLEGLPLVATATLYLQAFAANLVAAGQRLLPVGQTEGQRLLRRLAPLCAAQAAAAADGDLTRLGNAAFLADIAAMQHETQRSRIFRT